MKIKYEALRLFLAGTALTLTAMLITPDSSMGGSGKIHLEKTVSESIYNTIKQIPSKKSKSKNMNLASFHARR